MKIINNIKPTEDKDKRADIRTLIAVAIILAMNLIFYFWIKSEVVLSREISQTSFQQIQLNTEDIEGLLSKTLELRLQIDTLEKKVDDIK